MLPNRWSCGCSSSCQSISCSYEEGLYQLVIMPYVTYFLFHHICIKIVGESFWRFDGNKSVRLEVSERLLGNFTQKYLIGSYSCVQGELKLYFVLCCYCSMHSFLLIVLNWCSWLSFKTFWQLSSRRGGLVDVKDYNIAINRNKQCWVILTSTKSFVCT